jgi:hypothetical protein
MSSLATRAPKRLVTFDSVSIGSGTGYVKRAKKDTPGPGRLSVPMRGRRLPAGCRPLDDELAGEDVLPSLPPATTSAGTFFSNVPGGASSEPRLHHRIRTVVLRDELAFLASLIARSAVGSKFHNAEAITVSGYLLCVDHVADRQLALSLGCIADAEAPAHHVGALVDHRLPWPWRIEPAVDEADAELDLRLTSPRWP